MTAAAIHRAPPVPYAGQTRRIGRYDPASRLVLAFFSGSLTVLVGCCRVATRTVAAGHTGQLVVNVRSGVLARDGRAVRLSPMMVDIVVALFGRQGGVTAKTELFDLLYADRDDGGPLVGSIDPTIVDLRRRLAQLGLGVLTLRSGWLAAGEVPPLQRRPA